MMSHKLLEILSGPLKLQHQNNCLLAPIGGLEKVVELELGHMAFMREAFIHGSGVEVPDRTVLHHIEPKRP